MNEGIARPVFLVDHMLVKLGKYLRVLGFDAAWDPACTTWALIVRANREGRIFLTRNGRIPAEFPAPARWRRVSSDDPVAQVKDIVAAFGLHTRQRPFSRCIRCNVELAPCEPETARARVHPRVFARYRTFYRCPTCGTVFWKGSHVRNTRRKLQVAERWEDPEADGP